MSLGHRAWVFYKVLIHMETCSPERLVQCLSSQEQDGRQLVPPLPHQPASGADFFSVSMEAIRSY